MTRLLIVAGLIGVGAACLVLTVVRPTRRLRPLTDPYTQRARVLFGQPPLPHTITDPAGRSDRLFFIGIADAISTRISGLIDTGGEATLLRRLRQAGFRSMTSDEYRMRQLGSTVFGIGLFVFVILVVAPTGLNALLAAIGGAVWGAMRWRARIDKAITRRREQIRSELYTVTQLLAINLRAGIAPQVAIRDLATRGEGALCIELADVADSVDSGMSPRSALERRAVETPEPAAARLYRLLATAETGSGETLADSLLHAAHDLRAQHREAVERIATRRRFQMLMPTILVMGPVMLLFLAAPIPTLVFGGN